MKKKKVLVSFIEAGQGHIVTAEAIAEKLEQIYGEEIEVVRQYTFRDSGDKTLQDYEKFSIGEVLKANKHKSRLFFQCVMMKLFGERSSLRFVYSTVFKKVRNKIIKAYQKEDADLVLSTYFATYHAGIVGRNKKQLRAKIVAYNPDHNTHGWWDRRGDMFICNNPAATNEAINVRKMPKEIVETVNFMCRESVANTTQSKEFYREKLGIPADKFVVMLADGAYGMAKLEEFTNELIKTRLPITIMPLCGKNEKLLSHYESIKNLMPENVTLIPLPFLSNVAEYYKASDLFVTKAGPNALTDCVFMGTPVMTNFYTGPIEKASSELFTKTFKVGTYCPDSKKAKEIIEEYIKNPSLLDEMRQNTKKLDMSKNGATECAHLIAQMLGIERR